MQDLSGGRGRPTQSADRPRPGSVGAGVVSVNEPGAGRRLVPGFDGVDVFWCKVSGTLTFSSGQTAY